MFKLLTAATLALALSTLGCAKPEIALVEDSGPTYEFVYYSPDHRIMNIHCEKACILTADPEGNFIATMVDGSTITFVKESE